MSTTAQLSENSHQGFEAAKRMLCLAAMQVKSNTASGMPVCLRQNGIGSRSCSKERDAETGLDFFGARYYSGAQGRFTSPDPLLNSGRPWIPQSWNRYAYTLNNPLRYTDPNGLYEWAEKCEEGDSGCEGNRQKFRDALTTVKQAADQLEEGSEGRNKLEAILAKFGDEGEKTKVKIKFGEADGAPAEQSTSFFTRTSTITFDMNMIGNMLGNSSGAQSTGFSEVVTHEGSHNLDKFFFGNPVNRSGLYKTEFNAFDAQSYVPMGLNRGSQWGLWNTSWAEADRDAFRKAAVQKIAEEHVNEMLEPKKK